MTSHRKQRLKEVSLCMDFVNFHVPTEGQVVPVELSTSCESIECDEGLRRAQRRALIACLDRIERFAHETGYEAENELEPEAEESETPPHPAPRATVEAGL